MAYFREYPYVTEKIDGAFDPFLNKIKEIVVVVDQLFGTQIHPEYGVYPEGFADWMKDHPEYTTKPFTVTRLDNTSIKEIPYHEFYTKSFSHIINLLEETKQTLTTITDKTFDTQWWEKYLSVIQDAFRHDTWEDAEKYYLSMPTTSPILFSIGPIDPYHDKVLGTKRYFSAWLLIHNKEEQGKIEPLWNTLLEMAHTQKAAPIKLYLGDLLYSGGEVAKHNSMGWSRPENAALAASVGAVKAIALNKLPEHTKRMEKALFAMMDQTDLSVKTSEELMQFHEHHSLIPLLLHEIGHTYDKRKDAHEKLQEYYQLIEETRANTNMVYLAILLEKENKLPRDTARNIFLRVLFYIAYLYEEYTIRKHREEYLFAALMWFQKAEEEGIITVKPKHLQLHETALNNKLETIITDLREDLRILTEKGDRKAIAEMKKALFLYGERLATTLVLH